MYLHVIVSLCGGAGLTVAAGQRSMLAWAQFHNVSQVRCHIAQGTVAGLDS